MNDLTIDKLKYLIQGLTGKEISTEMLRQLQNDRMDLKNFQKLCSKDAGIPLPRDARDEKYEGITLYSENMFADLARQKFPQGVEVNFTDMNVNTIREYIEEGTAWKDYHAEWNHVPDLTDKLDVRANIKPDDYCDLWPDHKVYHEEEMDDWLNEKFNIRDDRNAYRSNETNYVKAHPELTGGKLYISEPFDDFMHSLTVEGRPFHEAVRVLLEKPDMTLDVLKELLRDPNKMQQFLEKGKEKARTKGNIATVLVKGNAVYAFQPGIMGYMKADANRVIAAYGKPLSEKCAKSFQDLAENWQVISYAKGDAHLFFNKESKKFPSPQARMFLDTRTGKTVEFEEHRLWDNKAVYASTQRSYNKPVIGEQEMKAMVDVKKHLTDVSVHIKSEGSIFERIMVRCKVNGEQQPFVELPRNIKQDYNYFTNPQTKEKIIDRFLAQQYADLLKLNVQQHQEQEQSKGMKR